LGVTYVTYEWDFLYVKYFGSSVKKPHEAQTKIQGNGYVSIRDMTESEESRWRQKFMLKEYDFSEYAEMNKYIDTLGDIKKI
jgi:hypothetical protein